jgi:ribosomal protein L31
MKHIDYKFENCTCVCDECDYETTIDSTNYSDINEELRDNGWITRKINGEWHEFCSEECFKKYLNKR